MKKNIIAIDCFKLVKGAGKSIGIYNLALNLVRNLAREKKTSDTDAEHGSMLAADIVVFGNKYNKGDFSVQGIRFVEINKDPLNKLVCIKWELFDVSLLARRFRAKKLLLPRGYASMLHFTEEVVIIHDMIPFFYDREFPGVLNRFENFYIMKRLKASARGADKVITISQASKNDILKYAGDKNKEAIAVINNGYNSIKDIEKYICEPKEDYIVALTSSLPHKNALGIIRAYQRYCEKAEHPLPIKIIGISGVDDIKGKNGTTELPKNVIDNISFIKYVDANEKLYSIIAKARIFLFLSLAEGFGFPPVEAMQLKTPVICSDRTSLPEVAADAALLVNPYNYDDVADCICRLIDNPELAEELVSRGLKNSERFAWDKIIKEYCRVLN